MFDKWPITLTIIASLVESIEFVFFICGTFWPPGIVVASVRLSVCLPVCVSVRVCGNHEFVRTTTRHPFKLGSPNFDQRCKSPWLRSLLFYGAIKFDLQGPIEAKIIYQLY